jgi:hypothetical protein
MRRSSASPPLPSAEPTACGWLGELTACGWLAEPTACGWLGELTACGWLAELPAFGSLAKLLPGPDGTDDAGGRGCDAPVPR